MTRLLILTALLLAPLLAEATQRIWYEKGGDYYDPINPGTESRPTLICLYHRSASAIGPSYTMPMASWHLRANH